MKDKQGLEHISWTQTKIAREFGMDARTVGKKVKQAGILPTKKLTTPEVLRVLFGDIDSERLRKTREEADSIALKNAQLRGELVELQAVGQVWGQIIADSKQRILNIPIKVESQYRIGMPQNELREMVEREIDESLNELAKPPNYT